MCSLVAEAIAVVRTNETPCVLGIWMQKGDLAHALPNLSPRQKLEALIRMVRGLSWVRENLGIIHRDLKPANVLLDQDGLAYLADWDWPAQLAMLWPALERPWVKKRWSVQTVLKLAVFSEQ